MEFCEALDKRKTEHEYWRINYFPLPTEKKHRTREKWGKIEVNQLCKKKKELILHRDCYGKKEQNGT